jgi:hypothetical protein
MGNAKRLPNGNTLITESSVGRFFEVTKEGRLSGIRQPFLWQALLWRGPPNSESNHVSGRLQ